jgi:hypothetical protein
MHEPGAAAVVGMRTMSFDEQLAALRERGVGAGDPAFESALETARPPEPVERSLLAWARDVLPVAAAAARIEREGKSVVLGHLEPEELDAFAPIEAVTLPDAPAYLALDVDLGEGTRNVRPEDALKEILAAGRSPLTIDEGIALMLQQPEVIAPNWGFSLAGSRRGDQRVPALWISEGRPKLGWCWDRNPHTWLGTASCGERRLTP